MSLLIRPATPFDAEAIAAVFIAARTAGLPWLRLLHGDAETRWWVRTVVLPTNRVWIAAHGGEVVGFAGLCGDVLEHLYVHPAVWSLGIGTQLLETARLAAGPKLALYAFQRNRRARRFYEWHGFTLVALGTGATNEEREPDAYYEWHRADAMAAGG